MGEQEGDGFRNVLALGAVSFFTDVSTEMILGLLPVFLVEELKAGRAVLGAVEGIAEALSYVLRTVSGFISDKIGRRKPLVLLGYAISNFAKPALAFATNWVHVLAIRATDRVGKGVRTSARDALLAESVGGKRLGKAFGIHRTLDQLGAVLGPALAAALLPLAGFRGVFLASLVPGVLALLVLHFAVKEVGVRRAKSSSEARLSFREVARGPFLKLLLVVALFQLGAFNFSFVLVRAREMGIPAYLIPLVYALLNVAHTAMGIPAGLLSDRVGGGRALSLGYALFAASSIAAVALPPTPASALAVAAIYGAYLGVIETVQRALVGGYAPRELRGSAYGLYYLVVGSAALTANTVFGTLWDVVGREAAYYYSTSLSCLSAILALLVLR